MNKRFAWLAVFASLALFQPSVSFSKEPPPIPGTTQTQPAESDLQEHSHYTNKKGETVHSPAHTKSGKAPDGASAHCRDGTYSFSRSRSGTCSHHGGVGEWL